MVSSKRAMQKPIRLRLKPGERRFILLTGDFIVALISMVLAIFIWARPDWLNLSPEFLQLRIPSWYYFLPFLWILLLLELYDSRRAGHQRETIQGIGLAAGLSLILYLLIYFTSAPKSMPRLGVAVYIILVSLLTLVWRLTYIRVFTARLLMRRVLIIGAGRAGKMLVDVISSLKPLPFELVGLIDDDPEKIGIVLNGYRILGGNNQLLAFINEFDISDLIFAISKEMNPEMLAVLMKAEEMGIEVTTMPVIYEELLGRVPISVLESDWLLRSFVDQAHAGGFYEMAKRLMDIIGSLVGTLMMVLLLPIIAPMIVLDSGFPVFYSQYRLGKNGKLYKIFKFRTMYHKPEKEGEACATMENDKRITRAGRLLRRSHLDELPQFINVLIGEMSLVGPRAEIPELADILQTSVPFYRVRLLVRPGLTGWAQVHYKYAATAEDTAFKLEHDLYYIKHRHLLLDFTILIQTIGTVLRFRGR